MRNQPEIMFLEQRPTQKTHDDFYFKMKTYYCSVDKINKKMKRNFEKLNRRK